MFKSIADYIHKLQTQLSDLRAQAQLVIKNEEGSSAAAGGGGGRGGGAASPSSSLKKRKLGDSNGDGAAGSAAASVRASPDTGGKGSRTEQAVMGAKPLVTVTDISFSVPQRKKFSVVVTEGGIAALLPATGKVEWCVRWGDLSKCFL